MSFRRLIPFILINILVSAGVVLAVLSWWERRELPDARDLAAVPIVTQTPVVAAQQAFEFPDTTPVANAEGGVDIAATPAEIQPTVRACPINYVVQPGDTLLAIGEAYELFQRDIRAFNNIQNEDVLSVGQTLILPCPEQLTPSPTPTPDPGVAPTPIPTIALSQTDIQVSILAVNGVGSLNDEVVVIKNETADSALKLLGWTLQDGSGASYTFGSVTVFDTFNIFTKAGIPESTNQYWGRTEPVWSPDELVTLYDADGVQRATFTVGQ